MLVRKNFSCATNSLNTAIERLTTGYRINSAKDDAAGKSVAIDMNVKLSSNEIAQNNVSMGTSLLNTAEGNVNQMKSLVQRCRDLCLQARNGPYGTDSQEAIKSELTQIVSHVHQIQQSAEFNGISLFENCGADMSPGGGSASSSGGSVSQNTTLNLPSASSGGFISGASTRSATVVIDEGVTNVSQAKSALQSALSTSGAVIGISNELGLQALAQVVNSGNTCSGKTIVLTEDINLSSISNWTPIGNSGSFSGTFDGNGHIVSNMKISSGSSMLGLFGKVNNGTISNTGVMNATINSTGTSYTNVGLLAGNVFHGNVTNCFSEGRVTANGRRIGGLVGLLSDGSNMYDSYSRSTVSGGERVGVLIGHLHCSNIYNSFAEGSATGVTDTKTLIGLIAGYNEGNNILENCYASGSLAGSSQMGGILGASYGHSVTIRNCYIDASVAATSGNGCVIGIYTGNSLTLDNVQYRGVSENMQAIGTLSSTTNVSGECTSVTSSPLSGGGSSGYTNGNGIRLQIGLDGTANSQITLNLGLDLSSLDSIIATPSSANNISTLDSILSQITSVETQIGAGLNRLESVQDSLQTQHKTLSSALSVVRDADVSQESARYIRSQILQQASASLLTVANQAPSLLLSLINGMTR